MTVSYASVISWQKMQSAHSQWVEELGSEGTQEERYGRGPMAEYNAEERSGVETG